MELLNIEIDTGRTSGMFVVVTVNRRVMLGVLVF